jgi:hypothetical protein
MHRGSYIEISCHLGGAILRRLPIILGGVLIALKLVVIVLTRVSPSGVAPFQWLISADPAPLWAAEHSTGLVFDQRRIWPTAGEALVFDGALVLFTGIE